ncbi:VOC family protein [Cryobacterium tagatosivorans]|uniref:VOC family protein n=1 Tax=Cryobacterium tagatosivorans TaxID=1259199 RepID=A0A4V3I697_9MICO|nr:VOC family protein [Cryobacterium tagatosivorans]TFB48730.1 VOC family protein [Cryobacterium tagatosivorans]
MTLALHHIVVDCADAGRLAVFWSEVLGRPVHEGADAASAFVPEGGPGEQGWLFFQVPEKKVAKNRMHVDFVADDREAEVLRLVGLGATLVDDHDQWNTRWSVLQDPAGNEFCVVQGR